MCNFFGKPSSAVTLCILTWGFFFQRLDAVYKNTRVQISPRYKRFTWNTMVWRYLKRTYIRMFLTKNPKPPFESHAVQIGDPVLRTKALPVLPENLNSKEVLNVRMFGKLTGFNVSKIFQFTLNAKLQFITYVRY